jgi:hypothetical protein
MPLQAPTKEGLDGVERARTIRRNLNDVVNRSGPGVDCPAEEQPGSRNEVLAGPAGVGQVNLHTMRLGRLLEANDYRNQTATICRISCC